MLWREPSGATRTAGRLKAPEVWKGWTRDTSAHRLSSSRVASISEIRCELSLQGCSVGTVQWSRRHTDADVACEGHLSKNALIVKR